MDREVMVWALLVLLVSVAILGWAIRRITFGQDWPISVAMPIICPLVALAFAVTLVSVRSGDAYLPSFRGLTQNYAEWTGSTAPAVLAGFLGRLYRKWPLGLQLIITGAVASVTLLEIGNSITALPYWAIIAVCILGLAALRWRKSNS
jgi:hypothetical protein